MCHFTDIYWACGPHLWQRFLHPCPNVLPGQHFCDSVYREHPRQRLGNCPNCPPMIRVMPESPYSNGGPPSQGQRQAQVHNQDQVPSQAGAQRGSEALMQAQAPNQAQAQLQAQMQNQDQVQSQAGASRQAAPLLQSPAQWQAQDQMQALVACQAGLSLEAQAQSQAQAQTRAEAQHQAEFKREAEAIAQLAAQRQRELQGRPELQTGAAAEAVEAARTLLYMHYGGGRG